MHFIYDYNALPFYSEEEILLRDRFTQAIAQHVQRLLHQTNPAWSFHRLEAPCLIPRALVSENYANDELWTQFQDTPERQLVLKPETTPSTYAWLIEQLRHQSLRPLLCAWQLSKSFRREQDQPTKHCRFLEFFPFTLSSCS